MKLGRLSRRLSYLSNQNLRELLLNNTPLIDVRAPVEFAQGHLPGAVNIPILNDEERDLIGKTYKNQGSEAAVKLGYKLVSGEVKEARLNQWISYIKENPDTVIYCFRGGQRSQITQKWIAEAGLERPLIKGGYKKVRNFLIEEIKNSTLKREFLIVSGTTGSGKTQFLEQVKSFQQSLDLEALANHRGSAFGAMEKPQPSQVNFENLLALQLLKFSDSNKTLLVEDESHTVGRCAVPKVFFDKMRASSVIWIEESLEKRVHNIFDDYIQYYTKTDAATHIPRVLKQYKNAVTAISKKLGGLRAQELLGLLDQCEKTFIESGNLAPNKEWIEKLLIYYYDPIYLASLDRRQVKILFKGSSEQCADFLKHR